MIQLVFASANENKVREIQSILPQKIQLLGLKDVGIHEEIPETTGTLEGNARQKADYVFEKTGLNCFSDDTGLEIQALYNAPGVNSAIYAGLPRSSQRNIEKVLFEMHGKLERTAQFRTVICYKTNRGALYFEGICTGSIGRETRGEDGFGYDGIFYPAGYSRTFAEMNLKDKKMLSHRSKAFHQFVEHLQTKQ
ncbi:MAG: RdgB/HAM1 family non-canonical purine NTP pyrophosphatase [Bacteroidota bacterium]